MNERDEEENLFLFLPKPIKFYLFDKFDPINDSSTVQSY